MFGNWPGLAGTLFDELSRWDPQIDDFFLGTPWESGIRSTGRGTFPPVNVGGSAEQVDVYLFAAGIDPESLDVSLRQNLLTISGERNLQQETDATTYRRERFNGSFQRVLTLPEDVDPDQVEARYRNGVLHVTVKRRESAKPRKIEIH